MSTKPEQQSPFYEYILSGEKNKYTVSFTLNGESLESNCTCDKASPDKLCWHRYYILAGKTSRLTGGDTSRQKEFLSQVQQLKNGKKIIASAKKRFAEDTNCRRCGSPKVVKVKYSVLAWMYSLFRENSHTYFCKDCKWTW